MKVVNLIHNVQFKNKCIVNAQSRYTLCTSVQVLCNFAPVKKCKKYKKGQKIKAKCMLNRGLEPRTLGLLDLRSDQLS
jgi:hypothetical protein